MIFHLYSAFLSLTHAHNFTVLTQPVLYVLQDDGPPDNPSDAQPSPITLHVENLIIHRKDDGSFSIGGTKNTNKQTQYHTSTRADSMYKITLNKCYIHSKLFPHAFPPAS